MSGMCDALYSMTHYEAMFPSCSQNHHTMYRYNISHMSGYICLYIITRSCASGCLIYMPSCVLIWSVTYCNYCQLISWTSSMICQQLLSPIMLLLMLHIKMPWQSSNQSHKNPLHPCCTERYTPLTGAIQTSSSNYCARYLNNGLAGIRM
jgi:hypothetical protein